MIGKKSGKNAITVVLNAAISIVDLNSRELIGKIAARAEISKFPKEWAIFPAVPGWFLPSIPIDTEKIPHFCAPIRKNHDRKPIDMKKRTVFFSLKGNRCRHSQTGRGTRTSPSSPTWRCSRQTEKPMAGKSFVKMGTPLANHVSNRRIFQRQRANPPSAIHTLRENRNVL